MDCWNLRAFGSLKPLIHLLIPLCVHWIAEETTVSVLVDVTTNALCPGKSTCTLAIYLTGLQRIVVGLFKMLMLPLLGQLADEYGRKPLLLITISTSIVPFACLALDNSRGFVFAYFGFRAISEILSQGSIFCIAVAYAADVVESSKRAATFGFMTGLLSASHVLGNAVARFLPAEYIFQVSIFLLISSTVYMKIFLVETLSTSQRRNQHKPITAMALDVLKDRWNSTKDTMILVKHSAILKRISFVSFFYELGITGISSILLYYLKAAFGFNKNQFSEILMLVGIGSIFSQMLMFPLINSLLGEKGVLCLALLASFFYAVLDGLAWAPWVPYLSAAFRVIYILVRPSIYTVISKAATANDQGKAQGFVAGVESMASFISPIVISPLTSLFLSENAPFNCKGFSILCASVSLVIALYHACLLKSNQFTHSENENEDTESPLLSS